MLVAPVTKIQSVFAADMVRPEDPLVKALGYVPVAKMAKDRKDKKAQCNNCQFWQGDSKAKTAKCQLIPTGEVTAGGWCRSYSQKQKKA